jgi:hypothetical protein
MLLKAPDPIRRHAGTEERQSREPSQDSAPMRCPFIYANGRQCDGEITEARAYGPRDHGDVAVAEIRKIRLWCCKRYDHVGAASSRESKERMEFDPSDLIKRGIYDDLLTLCSNVMLGNAQR